jgi:hypothetical protein
MLSNLFGCDLFSLSIFSCVFIKFLNKIDGLTNILKSISSYIERGIRRISMSHSTKTSYILGRREYKIF